MRQRVSIIQAGCLLYRRRCLQVEKECYFNKDSINAAGAEILQELEPARNRTAFSFDMRRAALLIVDMQDYFLLPESHAWVPSATAIIDGLQLLVEKFTDQERPVIFTRHVNTEEDAGNMAVWWVELLRRENPLSRITPLLHTDKGEILEKTQYDAFYKTDLEGRLRQAGVRQVVLGGVMTHLCCETTARAAFVRGFEIFFLADGTATLNRQLHIGSLRSLGHGVAKIVRSLEIGVKSWKLENHEGFTQSR